jgi:two-component system, NarL family, invasion response regulator UvrY
MIRLLIADDHPIVREGLKHVVSGCDGIRVVGEAEDGDSALSLAGAVGADVLLLDVGMPGPGILELIRRFKALKPPPRILVLSVQPEQNYARRVLKAGADGYLTKNNSSQALASAIRRVYSGKKYVSPALAEELVLDLNRGSELQPHETLGNREYQVFLQLGAGNSIDQIARELTLSPKTVRTYKSRIMEKMDLRSTAHLIFYAVRQGLITEVVPGVRDDVPEGKPTPEKSTPARIANRRISRK